jgi:hypothetical protein
MNVFALVNLSLDHLETFYNHDEGRRTWKTLESYYSKILACLKESNPSEYQTCFTDAGKTDQTVSLRPTWMCMQCTSIFSDKGRDEHFAKDTHSFCMNSA